MTAHSHHADGGRLWRKSKTACGGPGQPSGSSRAGLLQARGSRRQQRCSAALQRPHGAPHTALRDSEAIQPESRGRSPRTESQGGRWWPSVDCTPSAPPPPSLGGPHADCSPRAPSSKQPQAEDTCSFPPRNTAPPILTPWTNSGTEQLENQPE